MVFMISEGIVKISKLINIKIKKTLKIPNP
jgi:hypothetical protein